MNKERGAAIIFLLTGVYGLIFSVELSLGTWEEPGPAIFPLAVSILLCFAGVLTFVFAKRKEEGGIGWRGIAGPLLTPAKIVGLTAGYILVLDWLGYLLTSLLFIFTLFFWVSRYRFWMAAGLALSIGIGTWYFFAKILGVQLPGGILPL